MKYPISVLLAALAAYAVADERAGGIDESRHGASGSVGATTAADAGSPGTTDPSGAMGSGTTSGSGSRDIEAAGTATTPTRTDTTTSTGDSRNEPENMSGRDAATPYAAGSSPSGMDDTRSTQGAHDAQSPSAAGNKPFTGHETLPAAVDRTTTTETTGMPQPFGSMDADGDGLVSRREGTPLSATGHDFDTADTDGDGYLSAAEYNRMTGSRTP